MKELAEQMEANKDAQEQGGITLLVALGIAVGIVFISVIFYQLTNWNRRLKVTKNKPWQQG